MSFLRRPSLESTGGQLDTGASFEGTWHESESHEIWLEGTAQDLLGQACLYTGVTEHAEIEASLGSTTVSLDRVRYQVTSARRTFRKLAEPHEGTARFSARLSDSKVIRDRASSTLNWSHEHLGCLTRDQVTEILKPRRSNLSWDLPIGHVSIWNRRQARPMLGSSGHKGEVVVHFPEVAVRSSSKEWSPESLDVFFEDAANTISAIRHVVSFFERQLLVQFESDEELKGERGAPVHRVEWFRPGPYPSRNEGTASLAAAQLQDRMPGAIEAWLACSATRKLLDGYLESQGVRHLTTSLLLQFTVLDGFTQHYVATTGRPKPPFRQRLKSMDRDWNLGAEAIFGNGDFRCVDVRNGLVHEHELNISEAEARRLNARLGAYLERCVCHGLGLQINETDWLGFTSQRHRPDPNE